MFYYIALAGINLAQVGLKLAILLPQPPKFEIHTWISQLFLLAKVQFYVYVCMFIVCMCVLYVYAHTCASLSVCACGGLRTASGIKYYEFNPS